VVSPWFLLAWWYGMVRACQRRQPVETSLQEDFLTVVGGRRPGLTHWHGESVPAPMVGPRSNQRTVAVWQQFSSARQPSTFTNDYCSATMTPDNACQSVSCGRWQLPSNGALFGEMAVNFERERWKPLDASIKKWHPDGILHLLGASVSPYRLCLKGLLCNNNNNNSSGGQSLGLMLLSSRV